jgi:transcription-repair coupling factor (superfamily II helicase)
MSDRINKINTIKREIKNKTSLIEVIGISGSAASYLLAQALTEASHPFLIILPSPEEAREFYRDLIFFLPEQAKKIFLFPAYDISPLAGLSPPKELISQRVGALYALSTSQDAIVVTSANAIMVNLIPKDILLKSVEYIAVNEDIDREDFMKKLLLFGYFRTSLVEERGDFSVRGGVIDLYPPLYDSAIRIEFWGDTVESIRIFNPISQRSKGDIKELTILPVNEIILTPVNIKRARSMGRLPVSLDIGGSFPGQEAWSRHFYPYLDNIFRYLPGGGQISVVNSDSFPGSAKSILVKFNKEVKKFQNDALENGKPFPQTDGLFLGMEELEEAIALFPKINFFNLNVRTNKGGNGLTVDMSGLLEGDLLRGYHDVARKQISIEPLAGKIEEWIEQGKQIVLLCRTEQQAARLQEILLNYKLAVKELLQDWSNVKKSKGLYICLGHLSQGFGYPESALIIITEDEIFGKKTGGERKAKRDSVQAIPWTDLSQLQENNLVVHQDHGIGRYKGLSRMKIGEKIRDFVIIEYVDNDRLYIPAERINIIQKYVGLEDENPQLDRLGGRSWSIAKKKARKSIEKIAKELLKIYAMRKLHKGFAFSKPDNYYREFEATFDHEETRDQAKAIDDVLLDMESERPMDRLICGDVGFGKTEIAIRASFKAVMDGKQVAILSPTPKSMQKRTVAELTRGKVDIIIGTHRLLSDDIIFKDLGLLIIDEEQRFGVKAKEKLKKYRKSIDVLAITATPIPRTFHMTLMGVRDFSIIQTPPAERLAIQTYISKYDEDIISQGIERELDRGGQIFFVHNRVRNIDVIADRIAMLAPRAKIDIAHGRMREKELEGAMIRFLNKETDILVCTTIIDSGLDIPSANTIIINRVDRFGLSEIYQLRGRVGRSGTKAYAYLLISENSKITNEAQKRLKVLMDFSQLGSGVNIALNDLRIRGGGNILGFSQSGHIKTIGYELYLKLIGKTMAELKGEVFQEEIFPEINIDLPVSIPHDYIVESDVRLDIYRRLSSNKDEDEIAEMEMEIEDRFGPLPKEASNLISVIKVSLGLKKIRSKRLDINDGSMVFSFSEDTPLSTERLAKLVTDHPNNFSFLSDRKLKVIIKKNTHLNNLEEAENIITGLKDYAFSY